tara:strand:+ start:3274 stop:4908 length:1635 start_codon:yes stop_codon:yes gene_type:complete
MSAGSAFASGVRAGQAIWNNAIQNAMAGKRLDMLKTQFQFEQRQRKQAVENELAAQEAFQKFQSSIPTTDFDFKRKEDRDLYEKNMVEFYSDISRDPATLKQFEAYNKTMGIIGEADIANKIRANQANIGITWDLYNNGKPRPQILNERTGELVDDFNLMDDENYERTLQRTKREAQIKYGGVDDIVVSGEAVASLPPEMRPEVIRKRMKIWKDAVKSNDTDTIIDLSRIHSKAPDGTERQTLGKYKFTLARLGELKEQLEVVGDTGPIVGIFRQANPWDVKARLLQSQITKIIPGLARGVFGEVGVLTDQDVALYSKTLGTLTSPEEINELLTSAAIKMVANSYEDKLRGMAESKIDVSGFLPGLVDLRNKASELLGVEEPEIPVIEVESLPDSGAVTLSDEQAAAARAAAGPDGRVRVQQAGSDIIREINVNPPTEETVDEAPPPPVTPSAPEEDFSVWGSRHLEDFPPVSEEEQAAAPDRRSVLERRIEFLTATLENLPPDYTTTVNPYGPPSQIFNPDAAKRRKQLKDALRITEEELNKL